MSYHITMLNNYDNDVATGLHSFERSQVKGLHEETSGQASFIFNTHPIDSRMNPSGFSLVERQMDKALNAGDTCGK